LNRLAVGNQNSETSFTVSAFIVDSSDRNFLLNTNLNGGAKLFNEELKGRLYNPNNLKNT
jgi:hypothetical protein